MTPNHLVLHNWPTAAGLMAKHAFCSMTKHKLDIIGNKQWPFKPTKAGCKLTDRVMLGAKADILISKLKPTNPTGLHPEIVLSAL